MVGTDPGVGAVESGREVADHPPVATGLGMGSDGHPGADRASGTFENARHAQGVDHAR